jgi:hypothetical protein
VYLKISSGIGFAFTIFGIIMGGGIAFILGAVSLKGFGSVGL